MPKLNTMNIVNVTYRGKKIEDCTREDLYNMIIHLMNERTELRQKIKKLELKSPDMFKDIFGSHFK